MHLQRNGQIRREKGINPIMLKQYANIIIILGIILILVGILLKFTNLLNYFGKLPGDIYIKKENFSLYVPITTMVVISIILSILLKIFGKR
jgi:uncharacterized membrane protein YidH (DUF202 family)